MGRYALRIRLFLAFVPLVVLVVGLFLTVRYGPGGLVLVVPGGFFLLRILLAPLPADAPGQAQRPAGGSGRVGAAPERSDPGAAVSRSAAPDGAGRRARAGYLAPSIAVALFLVRMVVVIAADPQGEPGWTAAELIGFATVVSALVVLVSLAVVHRIRRRRTPSSRTRADRPWASSGAAGSSTSGSRVPSASDGGRGARPGSAPRPDRLPPTAPGRTVASPVATGAGVSGPRPRGRRSGTAPRPRSARGDGARLLFFLGLVVLGIGLGVEEVVVLGLGLVMLAAAVVVRPAGVELTEGYGRLRYGRGHYGGYRNADAGSSDGDAGSFSGGEGSADPGGDFAGRSPD